ncbi:GNAT family N-acetyltransferase [Roseateles sp. DAIF2]|nr:GNAT family N-acetyltransferase [Roseateles sp. DAIF2]
MSETPVHLPPRLPPRLLPGCELRLLREEQLPDYKALRDRMLAGHDEAFTSDAATELARSAESYRSRISQGPGGACLFTLTAWLDGTLIGAVSCEREPRQKVRHTAHLIGMMVDDPVQGRGIGRALLHAALRLLEQEDGIELVTLSVTSSNRGAVALYESMGFRRYGCLPRALKLADGRTLDKDLMCLDLQHPAR